MIFPSISFVLLAVVLSELVDGRWNKRPGWINNQGGWDNNRGGWDNNRGGWDNNRGGWDNNRGGWDNNQGGWDNNQGGWDNNQGGWDNNQGGWDNNQGGWDNNQGGWDNNQGGWDNNKPDDVKCGETPIEPVGDTAGIIGGTTAKPGSIPWQIGIMKDSRIHCGGSIINKEWILTAAHCVVKEQMKTEPSRYDIKVGAFDWENSGEDFGIDKVISHPDFVMEGDAAPDDIALIKVTSPITYSDKVRPVCLPKDDSEERKTDVNMMITGWGGTSAKGSVPQQTKLQQLATSQIDLSSCADYYLCFPGTAGGKSSFHGDSGGPLVKKRGDIFYQFGVVSSGNETTSVYTRVTQYCDWIEESIGMKFCK